MTIERVQQIEIINIGRHIITNARARASGDDDMMMMMMTIERVQQIEGQQHVQHDGYTRDLARPVAHYTYEFVSSYG